MITTAPNVVRLDQARAARAYREKVKVLCIYEATIRERGSTRQVDDGLMIEVEFSDQIKDAFEAEMKRRNASVTRQFSMFPVPISWELKRYVTSNGKQNF